MPYITHADRDRLDPSIDALTPETCGEFNYTITRLCRAFMAGDRYTDLNEVIGVLECAKQEFYRRVGVVIEANAIAKNGDLEQFPSSEFGPGDVAESGW